MPALDLDAQDVYRIAGPLDLTGFFEIHNLSGYPQLRDPHFVERGLFTHRLAAASGATMPALPLPIAPQFRDPPGTAKAASALGAHVDYVVKFNGGNNAGHTVVIPTADGPQKYALHLLPSLEGYHRLAWVGLPCVKI